MSTALSTFTPLFSLGRLGSQTRGFSILRRAPIVVRFTSPVKLRASSTAAIDTATVEISADKEVSTGGNVLACPICYQQLICSSGTGLTVESVQGTKLICNTCKKTYFGNEAYLDLTIASGTKEYVVSMPPATELFRTPLISFLYERGWRQNFGLGGYPGPEKEFEMAKDYLLPVLGGIIVDASCGSGLFSRLFAKSGLFSLVVALDYSEAMLQQCYEFINADKGFHADKGFPKEGLILVRADISRLPFVSSSVDAVHAGAALHCWPSPSLAVAEISRVLRPGGVFVATTVIVDGPFAVQPFTTTFREYLAQFVGSRVFLSEGELKDLCKTCGLVGFSCVRNRRFVMISATKPS
ncbi:hypothetical protein Ancab_038461 [Ancistrocladus abbreviatus]